MRRSLGWILLALALLSGAYVAFSRHWLCDDAFISFRYAANLVAGNGLVFNVGERVEGFSNFSWTMLCAAAAWLGLDPVRCAQGLGILCFLGTGLVLAAASRRLGALLPLAAVGFLLHRHEAEFASCGLETALFTLLVTALCATLLAAERPRGFAFAGVLAGLLALTRPDGAIFGLPAGIAALVASLRQRRMAPFVAYALPALGLLVPFLLWRHSYYGDWLPNTFYAKSGGDPYVGQGLRYVWLYLQSYWILVPAVLSLPLLLFVRARAAVLVAGFSLLYLLFVVWVGGDFMFARFLMPITPLLYLGLQWWVRRWRAPRQLAALAVVALGTLLMYPHPELRGVNGRIGFVGDEREQYPAERVAALRQSGAAFGAALHGLDSRVAFSGTQAMLVYEAQFTYALEAATGLTDRYLARRELQQRGPIGHEKSLRLSDPQDMQYVLQQRVQFLLERYPLPAGMEYRHAMLFGTKVTLVTYDRQVMRALKGHADATFIDFEDYLDAYLGSIDGRDAATVRADLAAFLVYYFQWNDDAVRLHRFEDWLLGK